ncbi:hypothetical protein EV175_003255 [Coemansia sp. RSA 1933]|nr:hypothetical protein EV175_003255 [Coemansia sp. RSA 1933]
MGSKTTSKKDKGKGVSQKAEKTRKIKDTTEEKREDVSISTSKTTSKRKRHESISSSSSSYESSSDSDDSNDSDNTPSSSSDSDSSSESGSSSSSNSDSGSESDSSSESSLSDDDELPQNAQRLANKQKQTLSQIQAIKTGLLPYVATNLDLMQQQKASRTDVDRTTRDKFKELYMEHVTTGFGTDLDRLRKEDDIDEDGLEMLVDVLEAAVDSFAITAADETAILE